MEEGIGGNIGDWNEEGEFDEEDASGSESEDEILEYAEVGPYLFGNGYWRDVFFTISTSVSGCQTCTNEKISDA